MGFIMLVIFCIELQLTLTLVWVNILERAQTNIENLEKTVFCDIQGKPEKLYTEKIFQGPAK